MHNQEGNIRQSTVDNPEVHSRQSTVLNPEAGAKQSSERDHRSMISSLSCNNQQANNELKERMIQCLHTISTKTHDFEAEVESTMHNQGNTR